MQSISTDINVPLALLDLDVLAGATQRSVVYANAEGTKACSVELRVTLLGASPVNLVVRYLGQNSTPAADPTRLLALDVKVPDTSALSAAYASVFILPVFTPFAQLEVQNVSGGNVHVQAFVQGCDADFVDSPSAAAGTASLVQLAAGSADAGTFHLATGAVIALATAAQTALDTLAGAIASGSIKAILQAGSAAIGKLAANSGVNIGTIDVATYTPWIDTVASADTAVHAYGTSQVVKTPVFIRAARTCTGTVTISDGTHTGMILNAGDPMAAHCLNLNTLSYQFSVNAATEKFSISAGI
jgi:hypothetical protein